jgi:putative transposase
MSFTKVWIHAVWGTKNREPVLSSKERQLLFNHIKEYARSKEIFILSINGHVDHVHCLFALNSEISLAKTMQLLKGESSHWANGQNLIKPKLFWADEYFAASVSESVLGNVKAYIDYQEEHHKKITFMQEHEIFMDKAGFKKPGR